MNDLSLATLDIKLAPSTKDADEQAPDPLCVGRVTDVVTLYTMVRTMVDVRTRANYFVEHNIDDPHALASLARLYTTMRTRALDLVASEHLDDATAFGLPECAADASPAEVGTAAELASTWLNALSEVDIWLVSKRVEAATSVVVLKRAAQAPEMLESPGEERPRRGVYL